MRFVYARGLCGLLVGAVFMHQSMAAARFVSAAPDLKGPLEMHGTALCETAKHTLAYLNKGHAYDPEVIHAGYALPVPLHRIKATLTFICQHQNQLNNPDFIRSHFAFIRWYPDVAHAKAVAPKKPLIQHMPSDRIIMTKYYVHMAKASTHKTASTPYALYALPKDETGIPLETADNMPHLIRFKYGKQAILQQALANKPVPVLAYLSRADLESALLQGTVVADFGRAGTKIFNVHRNNHIAYDRTKTPYDQERFWYFKEVRGIKGYGKDAEHKITVQPQVTFAADIQQFGLGKLLLVQYRNAHGALISRAGILADTGGAFADNLYQVDYLSGSYPGTKAFAKATRHIPDYVAAYFMVLKE